MKICSFFLLFALWMVLQTEGEASDSLKMYKRYGIKSSEKFEASGMYMSDDPGSGSGDDDDDDYDVVNDDDDGSDDDGDDDDDDDRNDVNKPTVKLLKTPQELDPMGVAILDTPQWKALMTLTATNAEMEDPDFVAKWVVKRSASAVEEEKDLTS